MPGTRRISVVHEPLPHEPPPATIHARIEGAEAAGTMILLSVRCACGGLDVSIVGSRHTIGERLQHLLCQHEEATHLVVSVPRGIGIDDAVLRGWLGL